MSDKAMTWEQAVLWLRSQPDMHEIVQHNYYDEPLIEASIRFYNSTEWQAVREILCGRSGKVLEIGAGRGIASFSFAKDGWEVSALEPNPSSIVGAGAIRKLSKDAGVTIQVVEEWGESLPFLDATFDLVYCRAVLHHAHDLNALGREIGRVLKPGGWVLACREHVVSNDQELKLFLDSHPLHSLYGGEHAYHLNEYIAALSAGGVNIEQVLNPLASDINLFPQVRDEFREIIARRLRLPKFFVFDWVLRLVGALIRSPGRLYTFIGEKPNV
jgi:SAM-dependent methyltransferase